MEVQTLLKDVEEDIIKEGIYSVNGLENSIL